MAAPLKDASLSDEVICIFLRIALNIYSTAGMDEMAAGQFVCFPAPGQLSASGIIMR